MKKKILTVAIAIAALCGIPAMAQTDNTAATQTQQCTKGQKGSCTNNNNRKQAKAAREFQRKDAFDGIQLTDAQKAGLEALNTTGAQKANRNDSTARANRRQARRDYVKGVKNVLTPDPVCRVPGEHRGRERPAPRSKAFGSDAQGSGQGSRHEARPKQKRPNRKDETGPQDTGRRNQCRPGQLITEYL